MEDLVQEIKDGNKDLYEKIVDSMEEQLYKTAIKKLRNEELAKDAVQETFFQAYNKLDQLKEPKYFKTWIIKILINKCNDINNARKLEKDMIDELKESVKEETCVFNSVEKAKLEKKELLEELNEKERDVFNLYYEEGYTTSEISKHLDMNENTVKSFLFRVRKKLRLERKMCRKLSKFFIFILAFIAFTSGIALGGRFVNNVKEKLVMFQLTPTKGIDDAKEYIQKVNTDFVYNSNIGIKVDSIAMDDKLLYVSYLIDIKDKINNICLEEYAIKDEANNLLAVGIESDVNNTFTSDYSSGGVSYCTKPVKQEDGKYLYSTTFQVIYDKDYPLAHKVFIEINEISILVGKDRRNIKGSWRFEIDLPDKFYNRTSESYKYEPNDKIKNIKTSLNDLSFELEIEFNENIDSDVVTLNNIILEDANGELINCYSKLIGTNKVTYICDISKHSTNIDKLSFYMKYGKGTEKCVDIILEK